MPVKFLYVLPLTSDIWRFKKAPGDSFGLTFSFINERRSFSAWPLSAPVYPLSSLVVPRRGITLWAKFR
jgi:hypothetical protein